MLALLAGRCWLAPVELAALLAGVLFICYYPRLVGGHHCQELWRWLDRIVIWPNSVWRWGLDSAPGVGGVLERVEGRHLAANAES